jgi:hypothetical protein
MQELIPSLTALDARRLTEEVKADAQRLWAKLLHLYKGGHISRSGIHLGQPTASKSFI